MFWYLRKFNYSKIKNLDENDLLEMLSIGERHHYSNTALVQNYIDWDYLKLC